VSPVRSVRVTPPSARREASAVLRGLFHIVFWSALVIVLERIQTSSAGARGGGASGRAPGPDRGQMTVDQRAFQDLSVDEQRVFLAVQEGLAEAERIRSDTGAWPTAAALAADGVPPFAPDPLDRVGYRWRDLIAGRTVNYLGTPPVGSDRASYLLLILEPEPGVASDPAQPLDEFHHRLGDGALLHVSTWLGPGLGDLTEATARLPVERGWRQIVTGQGAR